MKSVTVSQGPDTTKVYENPEIITATSGKRVRVTAFERRDSGTRRLISSLDIDRDELLTLLNAQPVKRARRTERSVSLRAKIAAAQAA